MWTTIITLIGYIQFLYSHYKQHKTHTRNVKLLNYLFLKEIEFKSPKPNSFFSALIKWSNQSQDFLPLYTKELKEDYLLLFVILIIKNKNHKMAARTRKVSTASDVEIIEPGNDIQTLHAMLRIIGDQLTIKDVKLLKFIYAGQIPVELGSKASDGFDFLLIMERIGLIDDTNYKHLRHLLKVLGRHDLLHFIRLGKRRTGIGIWLSSVSTLVRPGGKLLAWTTHYLSPT